MSDYVINIQQVKSSTTFEGLNFADMFAYQSSLFIKETDTTAICLHNLEVVPVKGDTVVRRVIELTAIVEA
jgi:hypothetical protein